MNKKNRHIDTDYGLPKGSDELFRGLKISWAKSKSDVWEELSAKIEEKPDVKVRKLTSSWGRLSVAASIVLLIGISAFLRLYTKNIYCPPGQNLTVSLPDGSVAKLTAATSVKFHPYWWRLSRSVEMEGEAFFDVKKGKKFVVASSLGKTLVLGTSFNIYCRGDDYRVTCVTGKVKVIAAASKDEKILMPNQRAEIIKETGALKVQSVEKNSDSTSKWIGNTFTFTSMPLRSVLNEIEQQYGVVINIEEGLNIIHSGNFTKEDSVEDVLDFVCYPLGIKFARISGNRYLVEQIK
jgi:ferric-dicitrate binding protein FerR (iron transport regulator)